MKENKTHFNFKEEKNMIHTGTYKLYGQLEEQAQEHDIEAFVFCNGEVVPASQAQTSQAPVIHTAPEKNYGLMEDLAKGNADMEEFVYRNGEVIPASQAQPSQTPVIHTAPEKNYGLMEELTKGNMGMEKFVYRNGVVIPASQAQALQVPSVHTSNDSNFAI